MVAVMVAVWPRGGDSGDEGTGSAPANPSASANPARLAAARDAAALAACPSAGTGSGPLAAIDVTCLGDGRRMRGAAVFGGQPLLVNVWATWCSACREELPVLAGYAARPGAARVLEVQVDSHPLDGLRMLTALGVHLPSLYDSGGLSSALRLPNALPASYLVDAAGKPHFIGDPRVFHSLGEVDSAVKRYGSTDGAHHD
ncbi:MAG: TlpA family protein disulfide reductase [Sciscionella sp.]